MIILKILVSFFARINEWISLIGRQVAWVLVSFMIAIILLQVVFRYVLNNALPWPEEASRALMIWMMAMVAGEAYRRGSFVAIDMFVHALPDKASSLLKLALFVISGIVLVKLSFLGVDFFEKGFRIRAASMPISRAWIYLTMPVCFITMLLANVELCLRELGCLIGREQDFRLRFTATETESVESL